MIRRNSNNGFSLIELIIAMSILMILSGMVFLGTNSARKKETEKYVNNLSNQIRMNQTTAMSKAGNWRLGLYLKNNNYYCVHEVEIKPSSDADESFWESRSEEAMMGHSGAVDYELVSGDSSEITDPESSEGLNGLADAGRIGESSEEKGTLIHTWRFNRDTGSCTEGAGTIAVTGIGKTRYLTVYRENGRCEISEKR